MEEQKRKQSLYKINSVILNLSNSNHNDWAVEELKEVVKLISK